MRKFIILFFLITAFLLYGCSKNSSTNTQNDLSKNAIKSEYQDVTKENPSLGSLAKGNLADIHLVEISNEDYQYIVCFKKFAPYKNISVYLDGDKLKVFYYEDGTENIGNIWIRGQLKQKIDVDNILVYKNNKLIKTGIERSSGIE